MADTDTRIIITAVDRFTSVAKNIEGSLGSVTGMVNTFKTGLASIGVGLSLGAVFSEFNKTIGYLADLDDAAETAGSSVESMSRLLGVAAEAGESLSDVVGYATNLQRAMIGAERDTGRAAEAFRALGLNLSTFDDSTEALIEFARALSQYEDGANKTQLAIAALGRSGAQALPFLKGLASASDLGTRYTSEQAAEAEKLQKQINRLGFEFEQAKVALLGGLIPSITTAITEFRLAREAGLGFWEALNTIAVGSKTQQIEMQVALIAKLRGELESIGTVRRLFDPGAEERLSAQLEIETKRLDVLKNQGRAQGLLQTQAEALYGPNGYGERAANLQAPAIMDDRKARAAAEATKQLNDAYFEAIGISKDYSEKVAQLEALFRSGRVTQDEYVDAVRRLAEAQPVVKANTEAQTKATRDLEAAEKDAIGVRQRMANIQQESVDAIYAETEKIREQVIEQRRQNEEFGLSEGALAELNLRRIDDAISTKEQTLAGYELVEGTEEQVAAIRDQIAALKALKADREKAFELQSASDAAKAAREAGEAANQEWVKASESIEKSLTDALLRGFESGKGFVQNLVDTAKNLFSTLVLRPVIQATVSPIAAGVGSLLGLPGAASAATGGGVSGLGIAGSLASSGGYLASGFMNTIFGSGLSGGLSAAGSLISGGSILSGGAMGLGAIAPYALPVIAALAFLSGKGGGPKSGGSSVINTLSGMEDGSRLFTPNSADATLQALTAGYSSSLSSIAGGLGGSAASLTVGLGYDTDPQGDASDRVSAFLMDAVGNALYDVRDLELGRDADIAGALGDQVANLLIAGLQASNLPQTYKDYFAQFDPATLSAEQADAAIAAANAAKALYESTSTLGGVFSQIGGLSVEARNGLVAMSGGLEQLLQMVSGYVGSYYSTEEQTGLTAAGIVAQLTAAGIGAGQLAGLDTKSEFRALVDSLDISGETGQRQLAALLSVSDEFASIASFLSENALDLSGAAALSPGGPMFEELVRGHEIAVDTKAVQTEMLQASRDQVAKLDAQITQTAAAYAQMAAKLDTITTLLRTQTSSTLMQEALP